MIKCNKPEQGKLQEQAQKGNQMIYELGKHTTKDQRRTLKQISVNDIMCDAIHHHLEYTNEYIKLIVIPIDDRKSEISKIRYHAHRLGFKLNVESSGVIIRLSITES